MPDKSPREEWDLEIRCPRDGVTMERCRRAKVRLAHCPKCHAVWLDGDEIAEALGPSFSVEAPRKTRKRATYGHFGAFISGFISAFSHELGLLPPLLVVAGGGLCHYVIENGGNHQAKRFGAAISILVGLLTLEALAPILLNEQFMGWYGFVVVVLVPLLLLVSLVSNFWKRADIALMAYQMILLGLSVSLVLSVPSQEQREVALLHTTLNGAILVALLHAYSRFRSTIGDGLLIAALATAVIGATKANLLIVIGAVLLLLVSDLFFPFSEQLRRLGLTPVGRFLRLQSAQHSKGADKDAT